jgi:DNA mismatch endonuclease (patch repair protein)
MAAVRGKDTRPEMLLRRALHRAGCRYRVHYKGVPGRPDIAFTSRRVVVFVDGDFWHGHAWKLRGFKTPNEAFARWRNPKFWARKINSNVERDKLVNAALRRLGWRVVRIWESELEANLDTCVRRVVKSLGAAP